MSSFYGNGGAPLDSPNFTGTPTTPDITELSPEDQITNKTYIDESVENAKLKYVKDYINGSGNLTGGVIEGMVIDETGENIALNSASGKYSHAEGGGYEYDEDYAEYITHRTNASGISSHAEGWSTTASGNYSHAEGQSTTSSGQSSHSEGRGTNASGLNSHVEGLMTLASGNDSHAEGNNTTASGSDSHAEGAQTTASGTSSHAEGSRTVASGSYSHAEGLNTIANHSAQHVFGEYNIEDPSTQNSGFRGTFVEIVGNGNTVSRSNARTLDWNGNEVLAGKLTVGAGPTNNMDVATKQYVDQNAGGSSDWIRVDSQYISLGAAGDEISQSQANIWKNNKMGLLFVNVAYVCKRKNFASQDHLLDITDPDIVGLNGMNGIWLNKPAITSTNIVIGGYGSIYGSNTVYPANLDEVMTSIENAYSDIGVSAVVSSSGSRPLSFRIAGSHTTSAYENTHLIVINAMIDYALWRGYEI